MTAYNQVNGQFASDHEHLLGEVLRGEWGFDGLVVSDWGGTNDHVAGLRVGMDLEMPGGSGAFDGDIAAAVADGTAGRGRPEPLGHPGGGAGAALAGGPRRGPDRRRRTSTPTTRWPAAPRPRAPSC